MGRENYQKHLNKLKALLRKINLSISIFVNRKQYKYLYSLVRQKLSTFVKNVFYKTTSILLWKDQIFKFYKTLIIKLL